jgi:hypothetical protein
LILAGVLLLGFCLIIYARALTEVQNYRAARLSNDGHEETLRASEDALDDLNRARRRQGEATTIPTEDELAAWTRAETLLSPNGHADIDESAYTTTDNNDMQRPTDDGASIPADEVYMRGQSVL